MSIDTKFLNDILNVEEQTKNVRMLESQFIAIVLPLLAQSESNDADLSNWLKITGSWQKGIDVYDDADNQLKLFEVPPLVSTRDIKISKPGSRSVNDIIEDATRKMAIVPKLGEVSLVKAMTDKIESAGDRNVNAVKWNYIFNRYGLPPLTPISEVPDTPTQTTTNISVSGYDEL